MSRQSAKGVQQPLRAGTFCVAFLMAAALLILTACGQDKPVGTASPGDTRSPAPASTAIQSTEATTSPQRVLRDAELMAISSKVLEPHGGRVEDTASVRGSYALITLPPESGPTPPILGPTDPAECNAFHRSWQHEAQLDPSMGFALAEIFNVGAHGTGMILFDVRSAPRERLVKADFDYSQELMDRCATFNQTLSSANGPQKFTIQLLRGPDVGEKAFVTKESIGGNNISVGLRVLAGTVSLDMGANTGAALAEDEALNLMSQIAQQFVEEMKNH